MKIDGRSYSPAVLEKAMHCVAREPAFHLAASSLKEVGEIKISTRHLQTLAASVGKELEQQRDAQVEAYFDQPLPRKNTHPGTRLQRACVSADGGRIQTRREGGPRGVHQPHWRETKNAVFLRMVGATFTEDPQPSLPACFKERNYMKRLLSGISESVDEATVALTEKSDLASWRPERLFRTCLSSMCNSDSFGRMMQAEADSRGFFHAARRAYLGDGQAYNWSIQKKHFRTFTPILDLMHALEHCYEAVRCVRGDEGPRWELYQVWAEAIWQGRVESLLAQMRSEQQTLGEPPKGCEQSDPRQIFASAIGYFENNRSRMDYASYRRDGLPITSAYVESYVKEVNYRVKGTEKFWNDGPNAEAILQLRAAKLCDDDRLKKHLHSRPGNPFRPNVKASLNAAA